MKTGFIVIFVKFVAACSFLLMVGCADPLAAYYAELNRLGYIPYTTPMTVAGTGTLIGGSPNSMEIIANPETCFPNIDTAPDQIRFRDDTVLPATTAHFSVTSDLQVSLFKALAVGAPTITASVQTSDVSTIELDFEGVHVEYLDAVKLIGYYNTVMSTICQDYLEQAGFIMQAIVADEMHFSLYTSDGGKIQISVNNIEQYLSISTDTTWDIDSTATLNITTPKYIGYQLGRLKETDRGLSLSSATKVQLNKWIYQTIGVFPK